MPFEPTDEQRAFLRHDPATHGRLHAGPGTGKSATAIAYLKDHVHDSGRRRNVRFLTFTRSTMLELRKKVEAALGEDRIRPSTVHSFAISILLRNEGTADFPWPLRIPDTFERDTLIVRHLARTMGVRPEKVAELFFEMAAKWTRLSPEESSRITAAERARFMGLWLQHRRVFGYTLLDEIPNQLREALKAHEDLEGVDIELLLVDEYQDLNACDLELLRLLAKRGATVIAIGDEDQSIYSFRRAHPAGIRAFSKDYGTSFDYPLSMCIRCGRRIMEWALHVIGGDTGRSQRPEVTFPEAAIDGEVALLNFPGGVSEAKECTRLVEWLIKEKGLRPEEILVLCRTDYRGTFTVRFREELATASIQVSDPKAVERWMEEPENRRPLALLRLLVNSRDSLAWWTLVELERGLGETFLDHLYEKAVAEKVTLGEVLEQGAPGGFDGAPKAQAGIAKKMFGTAVSAIERLILPEESHRTDWGSWIISSANDGRLPKITSELAALLLRLDGALEEAVTLSAYLGQVEPVGRDLMLAEPGGVRFMTMMGSKGLTVRATIVIGVDQDLIPRARGLPDEERRLLYVAMTRSTEYLFLTWASSRRGPAARAGKGNLGRRSYCEFLKAGPVESENGVAYTDRLAGDAR